MQLHWHTEPFLLLSILSMGWLYALAIWPFRERVRAAGQTPGDPASGVLHRYQPVCFYLGLLTVYLAVGSPLDQLGEQFLFSAHMVQHMMLIYLAPFLFYAGLPAWLLDALVTREPVRKGVRFLTHPVIGGGTFTVLYTAWHIPWLYEWALRDRTIHILEHACMFFPALLMLWPFCSTSRRVPAAPYGIRMLVIFILMVGQLPVFAFLSFSGEALYPTYVWAPRIVPGLDPLSDQILGGIIMKIVNMIVSLTLFGLAFYQWAIKDNRPDFDLPAPGNPKTAGVSGA
ncbi:MAG: cytochrome c oxidase assembly protein [Opitutales bacterium]